MEIVRRFKPATPVVIAIAALLVAVFAFGRIPVPTKQSSPPPPPVAVDESDVSQPAGVADVAGLVQPKLKAAVPPPAVPGENSVAGGSATAMRSSANAGRTLRLARSGAVDLIAPDVERALAEIGRVAAANGAAITGLNDERPANEGDVHRATVTVNVPAPAFDRTMSALAGVARMRSRRVDAEDVGDTIVDDGARLRNLRRTELDLLKIMDRSGRVSEVLDVERELATTREQIEQLTAELANTERRVALSTISVSLVEDAPVRPIKPTVSSQIAAAWHAALDQLGAFSLAALSRLFVILAFTPYLLALALAALAVRSYLRRRPRPTTP